MSNVKKKMVHVLIIRNNLCPQDSKCTAMEEGECMTNTHCKQYAQRFPGYSCNNKLCKGVKCSCRYKAQSKTEKPTKEPTTSHTPMCKDVGCEKQKGGKCMTKEECDKYSKQFLGYSCSKTLCEGKDCVCKYKEQLLCEEDIGCTKQEEGECMTKEACFKHTNLNKGYACSYKFCKGNNCVCKYKIKTEQPTKEPTTSPTPMCKDVGCKEQEEGKCMTKEACDKYSKQFPGYSCSKKLCEGNDCVCKHKNVLTKCPPTKSCSMNNRICTYKNQCLVLPPWLECDDASCDGKYCSCIMPANASISDVNKRKEENVFQKKNVLKKQLLE